MEARSWKPEVQTAGDGDAWTGNGLRFASKADSDNWAMNLSLRWTAVKDYRSVASDEEPNRFAEEKA